MSAPINPTRYPPAISPPSVANVRTSTLVIGVTSTNVKTCSQARSPEDRDDRNPRRRTTPGRRPHPRRDTHGGDGRVRRPWLRRRPGGRDRRPDQHHETHDLLLFRRQEA